MTVSWFAVVFAIERRQGIFGDELYLVLVQPLDRERQGSYTLKLVARDSGHPSRYCRTHAITSAKVHRSQRTLIKLLSKTRFYCYTRIG